MSATSIYQSSTLEKRTHNFLKKAKEVHGDRYDYSRVEYKQSQEKVEIICLDHGSFFQTPASHTHGNKCKECSKIRITERQFIERCENVHKGYYDYSLVEYKGTRNKIDIICPKHGKFSQRADGHQKGKGCLRCYADRRGGRTVKKNDPIAQDICYLYNIKLTGNGEIFYKWGITKDIEFRHYKIFKESGYNVEIIGLTIDTRIVCDSIERKLLKKYKRYKYIPDIKFAGYTECYKK